MNAAREAMRTPGVDRLGGVVTALVTPFAADGALDLDTLARLVDDQVAAGVAALVPCGTTGEAPVLTDAEFGDVIATTVEAVRGRVPIIAGAGANSTAHACALARIARQAGAQATLQVTPYYNRPTQTGLVRHYQAVADASELPIVLYNVPARTGVRLEPESIATLARDARFVALKDATGDFAHATRVRELAPSLVLLAGDDGLTLPWMALGATGIVSVTSNVVPEAMVALVTALATGDLAAARRLHLALTPLFRALFLESNPIPVKAALEHQGRASMALRLPLVAAAPATRDALATALAQVAGLVSPEPAPSRRR